jgi:hypothetical protein
VPDVYPQRGVRVVEPGEGIAHHAEVGWRQV